MGMPSIPGAPLLAFTRAHAARMFSGATTASIKSTVQGWLREPMPSARLPRSGSSPRSSRSRLLLVLSCSALHRIRSGYYGLC